MTKTSIIRTGYWVHQNLEDPNFDFLEYAYSGVHDLMEYLHDAAAAHIFSTLAEAQANLESFCK